MNKREAALALVREAKEIEAAGKVEQFLQLLAEASRTDPYLKDSYLMLGQFYCKEEKWEEALQNLDIYIRLDHALYHDEKRAQNVLLRQAKCCQKLGRKQDSLKYIKTFMGLFPQSPVVVNLVDQVYKKFTEREAWLRSLQSAGQAFSLHEYEEALSFINESMALNKKFSWAYYLAALALMKLARHQEAVWELKRAVEIDNEFLFHFNLAKAFRALGNVMECIQALNSTIELNPYYVPAYISLGELYIELKDAENAKRYLSRAHEIDPDVVMLEDSARVSPVKTESPPESEAPDARELESRSRAILQETHEEARAMLEKAKDEELSIILAAQEQAWTILEDAREEATLEREKLQEAFRISREEFQEKAKKILHKAREDARIITDNAREKEQAMLAEAQQKTSQMLKEAREEFEREREKLLTEMVERERVKEGAAGAEEGVHAPVAEAMLKAEYDEVIRKAQEETQLLLKAAREEKEKLLASAEAQAQAVIQDAQFQAQNALKKAIKEEESGKKEERETLLQNARKEANNLLLKAKEEASQIMKEAKREKQFILQEAEEMVRLSLGEIENEVKARIDKAQEEADNIIEKAHVQSWEIIGDAEKEAEREKEKLVTQSMDEVLKEKEAIIAEGKAKNQREREMMLKESRIEAEKEKNRILAEGRDTLRQLEEKAAEEGRKEGEREKAKLIDEARIIARAEKDAILRETHELALKEEERLMIEAEEKAKEFLQKLTEDAHRKKEQILEEARREAALESEKVIAQAKKVIEDERNLLKAEVQKHLEEEKYAAEEREREIIAKAQKEAEATMEQAQKNAEKEKAKLLEESRKEAEEQRKRLLEEAVNEQKQLIEDGKMIVESQRKSIIKQAEEEKRRILEQVKKVVEDQKKNVIAKLAEEKKRIIEDAKKNAEAEKQNILLNIELEKLNILEGARKAAEIEKQAILARAEEERKKAIEDAKKVADLERQNMLLKAEEEKRKLLEDLPRGIAKERENIVAEARSEAEQLIREAQAEAELMRREAEEAKSMAVLAQSGSEKSGEASQEALSPGSIPDMIARMSDSDLENLLAVLEVRLEGRELSVSSGMMAPIPAEPVPVKAGVIAAAGDEAATAAPAGPEKGRGEVAAIETDIELDEPVLQEHAGPVTADTAGNEPEGGFPGDAGGRNAVAEEAPAVPDKIEEPAAAETEPHPEAAVSTSAGDPSPGTGELVEESAAGQVLPGEEASLPPEGAGEEPASTVDAAEELPSGAGTAAEAMPEPPLPVEAADAVPVIESAGMDETPAGTGTVEVTAEAAAEAGPGEEPGTAIEQAPLTEQGVFTEADLAAAQVAEEPATDEVITAVGGETPETPAAITPQEPGSESEQAGQGETEEPPAGTERSELSPPAAESAEPLPAEDVSIVEPVPALEPEQGEQVQAPGEVPESPAAEGSDAGMKEEVPELPPDAASAGPGGEVMTVAPSMLSAVSEIPSVYSVSELRQEEPELSPVGISPELSSLEPVPAEMVSDLQPLAQEPVPAGFVSDLQPIGSEPLPVEFVSDLQPIGPEPLPAEMLDELKPLEAEQPEPATMEIPGAGLDTAAQDAAAALSAPVQETSPPLPPAGGTPVDLLFPPGDGTPADQLFPSSDGTPVDQLFPSADPVPGEQLFPSGTDIQPIEVPALIPADGEVPPIPAVEPAVEKVEAPGPGTNDEAMTARDTAFPGSRQEQPVDQQVPQLDEAAMAGIPAMPDAVTPRELEALKIDHDESETLSAIEITPQSDGIDSLAGGIILSGPDLGAAAENIQELNIEVGAPSHELTADEKHEKYPDKYAASAGRDAAGEITVDPGLTAPETPGTARSPKTTFLDEEKIDEAEIEDEDTMEGILDEFITEEDTEADEVHYDVEKDFSRSEKVVYQEIDDILAQTGGLPEEPEEVAVDEIKDAREETSVPDVTEDEVILSGNLDAFLNLLSME